VSKPAQLKQLELFLTSLPAPQVRKLAGVLEQDRAAGNSQFPHEIILNMLRPSLVAMRMPRHQTPQRILCTPFEDLLQINDPDVKELGSIARASIAPMWGHLNELVAEPAKQLGDALSKAQTDQNNAALLEHSRSLWRLAADTFRQSLDATSSDPMEFKKLAKKLGGARRVEDLVEMTAILDIAEKIENAKTLLPRKPIRNLNHEDVTVITRVYEDIASEGRKLEIYVILVVMGRLAHRFEILKVIRALCPKLDDTLASRTDLKLAGDMIIHSLERQAGDIEEALKGETDEDSIMDLVRKFAENFKGITNEIGIRRDGEWGQRMLTSRAKVSEIVETCVLKTASNIVLSAFPSVKGKRGTVVGTPDFSEALDEGAFTVAERRARAVADTTRLAEQLGVTSTANSTVTGLRKELATYTAKMIDRIAKSDESERDDALIHLYATVRLLELISGAEEADLFRRRGVSGLFGEESQVDPSEEDDLQHTIVSGRAAALLEKAAS